MRKIILYYIEEISTGCDRDYYSTTTDVVTSIGAWQEVSEEDYNAIKLYISHRQDSRLRIAEQVDYSSIIDKAKCYVNDEAERKAKADKKFAKSAKQREAAALKRKQKKLEQLKKELGESLPNHGKYFEPSSNQQS